MRSLTRRLARGQHQEGDAPHADASPERRLVLAFVGRCLLDACARPEARAWLRTPAFADWCAWADLPADRLRAAVDADPARVRRYARMMGWAR